MCINKERLKTLLANILSLHFFSYLRPGSNRHVHNGHRILSPARLPIPPLRHLYQSGKRDSNSRPRPWQGRALPTELFPQILRAENETRTRDPDLGKVVLYQLSYFRNFCSKNCGFSSRLGNAQAYLALRSLLRKVRYGTTASFYLKLRCKNSTFFNTCNIFLKKFLK